MAKTVDIQSLLDDVVTLPTLPATVAQITQIVNDPNASLTSAGKAVSADAALSLKTLRLVNSAFYGFREKVNSIEHAVVLLGMKVVKNVVVTASVFDTVKSGHEDLLRHNIACGVAVQALVDLGLTNKVEFDHPDEAFIYGLLHDSGKIILQQFLPGECESVAEFCGAKGVPWCEAEREIIGIDHAEIGAELVRRWQLSEELENAIAGHHDLSRCDNADFQGIAAIISIADHLAHETGYPSYAYSGCQVPIEAWDAAGLTPDQIAPARDQLEESREHVAELMEIAG